MTALFRRIQPWQKFPITKKIIARLLEISSDKIVRVESWKTVIFVHRKDIGGQFISYRKLQQWQNAIAYHIQNCSTVEELSQLWNQIYWDYLRHKNQYREIVLPFLRQLWNQTQEELRESEFLVQSAIAQLAAENFSQPPNSFIGEISETSTVSNSDNSTNERASGREPVRILIIGSRKAVTRTIFTLQHLGFAQANEWGRLISGPKAGEVTATLVRNLRSS